MLRAGLIGFGGISKSHRKGYVRLEEMGKACLVCACDADPAAFERRRVINIDGNAKFKEPHLHFYTDIEEMLKKEELDFLDICTPTYTHADITCEMLRRGYHVLCEKPMALSFADCEKMVQAKEKSGRELMIGQCLRFEPAYQYLKEAIDDARFGKVLSAFFSRLSPPPTWGFENWFMDESRSGGCITDLHIHDIDMARYLFGDPSAVSCRASGHTRPHDIAHTSLLYDDMPVTVVGDWSLVGKKFAAGYQVNFAQATVICDSNGVTVYPKDGSPSYQPELEGPDGYTGEISYFCDVIEGRVENTRNPATSAAKTVRLIEALRESSDVGGVTVPFAK